MARITIAGDAVVITSTQTLEDIKTLEKYRPSALTLYEENENGKKVAAFKIGSTTGEGSVSPYGISFGGVTHDDQRLATVTLPAPTGAADIKDAVADKYGSAVLALEKVEAQISDAVAAVAADREAVKANITIA